MKNLFWISTLIWLSNLSFASDCKPQKFHLTFDDGPVGKYTDKVLEVLKNEGIQATFFVSGVRVNEGISQLKRIQKAGHIVGWHARKHISHVKDSSLMGGGEDTVGYNVKELKKNLTPPDNIAEYITPPPIFRYPYGAGSMCESPKSEKGKAKKAFLNKSLKECGFQGDLYWNVDSGDAHPDDIKNCKYKKNRIDTADGEVLAVDTNNPVGQNSFEECMTNLVVGRTVNACGGIILMHDSRSADRLQEVIRRMKSKGIQLVGMQEMLEENSKRKSEGKKGYRCIPEGMTCPGLAKEHPVNCPDCNPPTVIGEPLIPGVGDMKKIINEAGEQ